MAPAPVRVYDFEILLVAVVGIAAHVVIRYLHVDLVIPDLGANAVGYIVSFAVIAIDGALDLQPEVIVVYIVVVVVRAIDLR